MQDRQHPNTCCTMQPPPQYSMPQQSMQQMAPPQWLQQPEQQHSQQQNSAQSQVPLDPEPPWPAPALPLTYGSHPVALRIDAWLQMIGSKTGIKPGRSECCWVRAICHSNVLCAAGHD